MELHDQRHTHLAIQATAFPMMPYHQKARWIALAATVVVVVALYMPMKAGAPVLDDPLQMSYVQGFESWTEVFGPDSQNWFRPLKNLVFYLTQDETGNVAATKIVCLVVFLINILLCNALLTRLSSSVVFVALGTALFALNPTQVATVQFMSAVNNQLCLSFLLGYLICGFAWLDRTARESQRNGMPLLFTSQFLLALALISYEAAVTAVGVMAVLIASFRNLDSLTLRQGLRLCGSSALVTFGYLVVRHFTVARNDFVSPSLPPYLTSVELILRAPYYLLEHALLWLVPWGRGGVFIDDDPRGKFVIGVVGWVVLALVIILLLRLLFSRYRAIAGGGLIFAGGMVPLANFLGLGNGPICNYYLLLPGLGLAVAAAEGARLLISLNAASRRVTALATALLLVLLSVETRWRVDAWNDGNQLIEMTMANYPDNYHALYKSGFLAIRSDQTAEGIEELQRSHEIAPWYIPPVLILASSRSGTGDDSAAIDILEEARSHYRATPATLAMRLAEAHIREEDFLAAQPHVERLLAVGPPPGEEVRVYLKSIVPYLIHFGQATQAQSIVGELSARTNLAPSFKADIAAYQRLFEQLESER